MTRNRPRLLPPALLGALVALAPGACDEPDPVEPPQEEVFKAALPASEVLSVELPGAERLPQAGASWTKGAFEQALESLPSRYHRFTIATSASVNLGLRMIADGLRGFVDSGPPAVQTDARLVWLSKPNKTPQFGLVIDRTDVDLFDYQLGRRPKAAAGLPWTVVIAGQYTPAPRRPYGQGAVWIDLDQDQESKTTGKVLALWSKAPADVAVTVYYYRALLGPGDPAEGPRDAVYHYVRERDGSGTMVFAGPKDVDEGELGDLPEEGVMITRWDPHGAGRSDVTAKGGDFARLGFARALRSECWGPEGAGYELVYRETWLQRPDQEPYSQEREGDPKRCAFHERGTPVLPPQGDEPPTPPPSTYAADGS